MNLQRIFHYLYFIFLPVLLALVFAVQNQIFNNWLHLQSAQYSVRLLFSSFALGLILYSPCLFFKKNGRYAYLLLVSLLISAVFIIQFISFEYNQSFFQISALRYINQAFAVRGTVGTFLSFSLGIFLVNIALVILAWVLSFKNWLSVRIFPHWPWGDAQIHFPWWEKLVLFLLLILIAFSGYTFLIREEKQEWGDDSRLYADVYDLNTLVEKIGIVNFTLEDAVKYATRSNLVSAEDKVFLAQFAKNRNITPVKNPQYFGIAKGKNVIIIQIESLENCVINQSLGGQEITPNLNQLTNQGLYFTNYYTQVGPGNTADAEFSILDSLYPLSDDVVFVDYAQNTYNALPKVLVKNNYHTYALHGDVPTFWNRSNIYLNLGYQTQISEGDYVMTRPVGHGPSPLGDEDFLTQSLIKMQTFKQPFLSTLITLSSHTPFELPQDLQTLPIPANTNLNYTQQQYLESVHYADKALGEFMAGLEKEPFYKNSIIFIYGDHESYTNICDQLDPGTQTLPALFESQVPLIVLNSGIQTQPSFIKNFGGQTRINIPASHLDFYPTVLNLLGIKSVKSVLGQDIFNTQAPVVTRRNIFSGTINTILTNTLAFKQDADGDFENGTCLAMPQETPLPVADCKTLFDQQADITRASDIIIRGNLLKSYVSNLPK